MNTTNYKYQNEREYILRLSVDDEDAFRFLYIQYRSQVYHTAYVYLKSKELAKDVVQDVFMKLWLERTSFQNFNSIKGWLYTVSKNNILNKLKRIAVEWKAKEYMVEHNDDSDLTTVHKIYNSEYNVVLDEVINSLPDQQKIVFKLAKFEQMSYEDIGKQMNISPLTVKTHMSRAMRSVRDRLLKHGVDAPLIIFFLEEFF